jgi:hypothetical protein
MARKKVAALLVDVLVDAGVERADGIWSELVSDPEPIPRCPGNRHSDCNLAPQRLCDRSYDEVNQTLARQWSFF